MIKPIVEPFYQWCAGVSVIDNFVILDTETTGMYGEVIDLAIVDGMGRELYQSLLKPRGDIEPGAEAVHHISNAMVANAPTIEDEWHKICDIVDGRTVITYNAKFDSERINTSLDAYDIRQCSWCNWTYQCAMTGYADFWGAPPTRSWNRNAAWQSLSAACTQQGVILPKVDLHRAMPDTVATFLLISKIAAMGEKSPRFLR